MKAGFCIRSHLCRLLHLEEEFFEARQPHFFLCSKLLLLEMLFQVRGKEFLSFSLVLAIERVWESSLCPHFLLFGGILLLDVPEEQFDKALVRLLLRTLHVETLVVRYLCKEAVDRLCMVVERCRVPLAVAADIVENPFFAWGEGNLQD